jgi:hypothetical protein
MKRIAPACAALLGTLALGACVVPPPTGPNITAMPPQGKDLQAFQQEDVACREYAMGQAGISPGAAAQQSQFNSAALGTVLGAGLGAAIGAAAGNPGIGAAIGAGSGAIIGTGEGARAAAASGASVQQRIDSAYAQCMASKGNSVPQMAAASPYPYPAPAPAYAYPYPYSYGYYGGPYYYPPPAYVYARPGWRWR